LIVKAWKDETYRQTLVSAPRAVLERESGVALPEAIHVTVLEESPSVVYLVLPARPAGAELEDRSPWLSLLGCRSPATHEPTRKTRRDIEVQLIGRAWADSAFKEKLLRDPKAVLERELGAKLPEDQGIQVVEETRTAVYLVLPRRPDPFPETLSDEELEDLAGGFFWGIARRAEEFPP
jgi:hypothetical protein